MIEVSVCCFCATVLTVIAEAIMPVNNRPGLDLSQRKSILRLRCSGAIKFRSPALIGNSR